MKTLYLERSTGACRDGRWVEELDFTERPARIVVGTGPGSFAGIRSAIAFAQGYRLGSGAEVLGLPSPCAVVGELSRQGKLPAGAKTAVVGDARQEKIWVALFEGMKLLKAVFQVEGAEGVRAAVPADFAVYSSDDARIGELLRGVFAARYRGLQLPTDVGLEAFALASPELLVPEPLPLYLNPAVR